jgi:4-amino-4-deoxy-L-arabinose transferase-like glycosyltransferase
MGDWTARVPEVVRHHLLLLAVAALVFLFNLGGARLWDEDEPKNAQCAREMLARGDWIVPTFNQELRTDKPVLLYWLMMPAYLLLGVSELAARLPSALLAIGTTLLTYHLGRRLFSPRVGLWAGITLATSLMFTVAGRAATPDSTLIFFTTLTMLLYVVRVAEKANRGEPARGFDYALVFVAMGLAVLAKGPVGLVLPLGVLTLYARSSLWQREAKSGLGWRAAGLAFARQLVQPRAWWQAIFSNRPIMAVAVVAAIALPWYITVGVHTDGEWLRGFLGKHNVDRFLKPMEGHNGPIIYYVPAVLIGMFPWSVFLPLAIFDAVRQFRRTEREHSSLRIIVCWAGLYLGFFSLASTKLPSYVLPAYPALAILIAVFLERWINAPKEFSPFWVRFGLGSLALVGIGLCVALPIVAYYLLPGEYWLGAIGLAPLAGGLALLWQYRQQAFARIVPTMAVMAIAFSVSLFGIAGPRISLHQNSQPLVSAAEQFTTAPKLGTFAESTPSLVYYAADRVERLYDPDQVREFLLRSPDALVVTRTKSLETLRAALPDDVTVLERERKFLRRDDIVLLGRKELLANRPRAVADSSTRR